MNEINKYNASEMLTQYMDGELDQSLIPAFENELSTNSELQSEYREMLAIREAVQKDVKKLVPPYETSATLFESLGISYTSSIATSSSVGMTVWQQLMMPLVASISAAAITLGASLGIDFFKDEPVINELTNISKPIENNFQSETINKSDDLIQDNSNIVSKKTDTKVKEIKALDKKVNNKIITNNNSSNFSNVIIPNKKKEDNIITKNNEILIASNESLTEREIFEIFSNDILEIDFSIEQSNIGSKLNYNYNEQKFERYSSGMKFYTGAFGFNNSNVRLSIERNFSNYKLLHYTVNSIGVNLSFNLFSDSYVFNNFNLSADLRHEFKGLINNFTPVILVGTGYDFNSTSPILRYGIAGIVNLPNNFQLEGRFEINSLTNQNINLQQLNYTKNNQGQVVLLIKHNF